MDSVPQHHPPRVYLSPPHLGNEEAALVADAFSSNWIAPLGPHVEAFEKEFCLAVGCDHAVALSSGTAALHLALLGVGVRAGDDVFVSTLTFAGGVYPIRYAGATPVFVDSERESWNMDPALLEDALERRAKTGRLPRAVVVVHIYGQCADLDRIIAACSRFEVPVIEDAAEALGATYQGRAPGTFGVVGAYSFNGNKVITTSGGGMLVSADRVLVEHARKLATQARDPAPHYEHSEIGYNYRLSNVLAAIGRGQLRVLEQRVAARRRNFSYYRDALAPCEGITFMPEAAWGLHARWLTVVLIDPASFRATREDVRLALEAANIEARPLWKPMHLQPVFRAAEVMGGEVSEELFERGLCLPSGSSLTESDLGRVVSVVKSIGG